VQIDSKNSEGKSPYRWFNPEFKDAYYKEADSRNINPNIAWDGIEYVNIEDLEEFLSVAKRVFNEGTTETEIELVLDHDVLFYHFLAAHKQDITFNEYINNSLRRFIEEIKVDV
jgi:hypothetical protein